MEFIIAYFKGWILTFRRIGMWLLLYLFNFLFALLAALPMFNLLENKLGRSLEIEKLMPRFDFTVFSDFINQYSDSILVLLDQSRCLIVFFFIFSIFLNGGILNSFKHRADTFNFRMFWSGCTRYFWRMLRLTVYFFAVHIIVLALFIKLFFFLVDGDIGDLESELELYQYLRICVPIYLMVASVFFMIHDYAKVHMVHEDKRFLFLPFWQSFGLVFKHFLSVLSLYWLNLLTLAGLIFAYISLNRPADSAFAIWYTFLIGQAFVIGRVGMKLLNLASATVYYQENMQKKEALPIDLDEGKEETILIAETTSDQVSDTKLDDEILGDQVS